MDFLFDLDGGTASVVGLMHRAVVLESRPGARLFGVRFQPGAAALFVDAPAHELADRDGEFDELLTPALRGLADRVAEAPTDERRRSIVVGALLDARARLRASDPRVARAVGLIRRATGNATVRAVAAEVGVGERQLERLFRERVGSRAKHFCRVVRMQRVLSGFDPHRPQDTLAAFTGYADTPHMLRDFRDLAGATPREIAEERRVGFVQGERPPAR